MKKAKARKGPISTDPTDGDPVLLSDGLMACGPSKLDDKEKAAHGGDSQPEPYGAVQVTPGMTYEL